MQKSSLSSRQIKPGVSVGFISLLMIFMVLCLAVFVVLSLSVAVSDSSLTDRTGQTIQDYFSARNRTQQLLSELDILLLESNGAAICVQELSSLLTARGSIRDGELLSHDELTEMLQISIPAGERLFLNMEIVLDAPGGESRYRVLSMVTRPSPEDFERPAGNLFLP